jgi:hypothetical protein
MQRDWRGTAAAAGIDPVIVYQNNAQTVSFWPPPAGTGTVYFEYPVLCTMTTTVSSGTFVDGTMAIPAWTRYSAIPYCRYRAYSRFGPNQDINKASRARKSWDRQKIDLPSLALSRKTSPRPCSVYFLLLNRPRLRETNRKDAHRGHPSRRVKVLLL